MKRKVDMIKELILKKKGFRVLLIYKDYDFITKAKCGYIDEFEYIPSKDKFRMKHYSFANSISDLEYCKVSGIYANCKNCSWFSKEKMRCRKDFLEILPVWFFNILKKKQDIYGNDMKIIIEKIN